MRDIVLLGAVRTPIGALAGAFAQTSAAALGIAAARATLERAGAPPESIDETIIGNVLQAGQGMNPARQIALGAGLPESAPAFTVNKVCGSGMKTLDIAWQAIQLERARFVLAGGVENMTQAPYLLPAMRQGARLGDAKALDHMTHDGLTDVFHQYHMGITAENIAEKYGIGREEQDTFALDSQRKCAEARGAGRFADEIVPVMVKARKEEIAIAEDEHPRPNATIEALAKLRPAFKPDGSVTAANASGINDGASTLLVADAEKAREDGLSLDGAVYLRDVRSSGCAPAFMGLGPVGAVQRLLKANGLGVEDIDLWELNEAFAVQSIAVVQDLGIDAQRVNVNGGAIALGHPIGCSGARIVTTLIHEMRRRGVRRGVAAMCIGGGQGIACLIENPA